MSDDANRRDPDPRDPTPRDPDVHVLTGAYALDAVDDLEREQVDRLLSRSPTAAAEVASFRETAARLATAEGVAAPASLRANVLAQVRTTRQLPPVTQASSASASPAPTAASRAGLLGRPGRPGRPGPAAVRWLSVAAACLLAVAVGLGAWVVELRQDVERSRQAAADAVPRVLQDPDRQVMETDFAGGKATMVVSDGTVVLFGSGVQAPPTGHGYQLWMLDEAGVPRPSVMLTSTGAGGYFAETEGYRPGEKMAVTIEPAGGSQEPTTDPVFVAGA